MPLLPPHLKHSFSTYAVQLSILDTLKELSTSDGEFVPVSKIVENLNFKSEQGTTSILLLCSSFDIVQYQVEKVEIDGQIKRKYSFAVGENFQSLVDPNSKLHLLAKYVPTGNFEALPSIIRNGEFPNDEELRTFFLETSNLLLSYCHRVDANEDDEFTISFEERIIFLFYTQILGRIHRDALSYFGIPHLFYNLIESKETNDEDKQIKENDLLLFITNGNEKTQNAKIFLEILVYTNWLAKIEQNGEIYYKKGTGLFLKENCPKTFGPNQQSVSDLYSTFTKEFAKSIATGKSAVSFAFEGFDNFFEVLKTKPDLLAEYHQRTRLSTFFFANQAVRYDYSRYSSLIEVGGSLGYFILALLEKYPNSKGVVFDLPSVVEDGISQLYLVDESVSKRCQFVGGSFFESVPVAPEPHALYLIKNVLHDWVRADQVKILKTVAAAMKKVPDSVLQIVEVYFDEENILEAARFDIHTLTCWGSSVLSFDDYRSILNEAGFEVTEESRIAPGVCAIDAKLRV